MKRVWKVSIERRILGILFLPFICIPAFISIWLLGSQHIDTPTMGALVLFFALPIALLFYLLNMLFAHVGYDEAYLYIWKLFRFYKIAYEDIIAVKMWTEKRRNKYGTHIVTIWLIQANKNGSLKNYKNVPIPSPDEVESHILLTRIQSKNNEIVWMPQSLKLAW